MSNPLDKEAVLDAFASEPTHDRATLERYLRKYPELVEDLVELCSELRLSAASSPSIADSVEDPGLEAAWSEFLACAPAASLKPTGINLFAGFTGVAFANLAKALNVPRSILTALRDGLVVAESVPSSFASRFAEAASTTADAVRAYLARPHDLPVDLAFKSDTAPSHQGQTTFRQLILATEMSDEQRRILLHECDEDELS